MACDEPVRHLAAALQQRRVPTASGLWTIKVMQARRERHGFIELLVVLQGVTSYDLTLCVSEEQHELRHGREVEWILNAISDWLDQPGALDGDTLDLVS